MTAIEAEIKRFPAVVETKLKERAVEERESREGRRDLWIRYMTLACAIIGAGGVLFKVLHG